MQPMQQYNMLQAIFMSFYSKKLYRDVAINWGGKAFLYLLLILALSWVYATYQTQHFLTHGFKLFSEKLVTQIPVMTIKNGMLSTPQNRPYLITDPDAHTTIAIIDTTGQYKTLEQTKASLLVTQTEIISQSRPNEYKINEIPKNLTMTLVPQTIKKYVQDYLHFAWILIFIAALMGSYVYRLVQVLLYSIIGKIFSVISNAQVSYGQIIQITMVAITPVIIIATILNALGVWIQHEFLLYFVLAILYMFYGIIANKNLA
jgi:hypothetical protein